MTSLESMKRMLSSLGIYDTGQPNLSAELAAYSAGLDEDTAELDTLLWECFVQTASDYGLSRREMLIGAQRSELPVSVRRNMLLSRLSLKKDDFTLSGVAKLLQMLSVVAVISEYPHCSRITLDMTDRNYPPYQRDFIRSQVAEMMPAHLECDTVFSGLDWGDIDGADRSFDALHALNYTWQTVDRL